MNFKTFVISSMLFLAMGLSAYGQDIVYDTDNNVYEGYISKQIPGVELVVCVNKSTMQVPAVGVSETHRLASLKSLPAEYRTVFADSDLEDKVDLVTLVCPDGSRYVDVAVLESGAYYRFVSFESRNLTLKWNKLSKVAHPALPFNAKSGLYDVLLLKTGARYEGHILEQSITNNRLKIQMENGSVKVFDTADIMTIRVEPISKEIPVWEQSLLFDRLELTDGSIHEGLIVSKVLGKNVELMEPSKEGTITIPVYRIVSYGKYENSAYVAPEFDIAKAVHRSDSDLTVNGRGYDFISAVSENGLVYAVADVAELPIRVSAGESMQVCIKSSAKTYELNFYLASAKKSPYPSALVQYWPAFKQERPCNQDIHFISADGTYTCFECVFQHEGVYVLYIPSEMDHCVVFDVKLDK